MKKSNNPAISIIIINYNGKEFLFRCLDSVLKADFSDFELIFVDNNSADGSIDFVRSNFNDERISFIENDKNYGVPGGRNIGSKKARGDYLVFLDNDTEVDCHWLDELMKVFRSDAKIAVAQCKLLNMVDRRRFDHAGDYLTLFGFLSERSRQSVDTGQFDAIEDIASAKGAATMMRRSVFEDLGRYDDSFFMYLEETDFCLRAWLAGYRVVFSPRSVVWHAFMTPLKETSKYYSRYIVRYYGCRNYITTLLKNLSAFNLFKLLPFHLISWFCLSVLFVLKGKPSDALWVIKGIAWNIVHVPSLLKKRFSIQRNLRKVDDKVFLRRIMTTEGIPFYLKKAFCYLNNTPFRKILTIEDKTV